MVTIITMSIEEYANSLDAYTEGGLNLECGYEEKYFYTVREDYTGDDEEILEVVSNMLKIKVDNILIDDVKEVVIIILYQSKNKEDN